MTTSALKTNEIAVTFEGNWPTSFKLDIWTQSQPVGTVKLGETVKIPLDGTQHALTFKIWKNFDLLVCNSEDERIIIKLNGGKLFLFWCAAYPLCLLILIGFPFANLWLPRLGFIEIVSGASVNTPTTPSFQDLIYKTIDNIADRKENLRKAPIEIVEVSLSDETYVTQDQLDTFHVDKGAKVTTHVIYRIEYSVDFEQSQLDQLGFKAGLLNYFQAQTRREIFHRLNRTYKVSQERGTNVELDGTICEQWEVIQEFVWQPGKVRVKQGTQIYTIPFTFCKSTKLEVRAKY